MGGLCELFDSLFFASATTALALGGEFGTGKVVGQLVSEPDASGSAQNLEPMLV